jgi:Family of unknown function (DUF6982)
MTGPEGMADAKVVARYLDGRLLKGYTYDFRPDRRAFHVFVDRQASADPVPIVVAELKALFSVRDFAGNPRYTERKTVPPHSTRAGQATEVGFSDGEVLVGFVTPMPDDEQGFFLVPADPASNNLRVFVPRRAVQSLRPVPRRTPLPRESAASAGGARPPVSSVHRARPAGLPARMFRWLTQGLSRAK